MLINSIILRTVQCKWKAYILAFNMLKYKPKDNCLFVVYREANSDTSIRDLCHIYMKERNFEMNNADYGLSLQKSICEQYGLEINEYAQGQFTSNYNSEYWDEFKTIIPNIFQKVSDSPVMLLTYTQELKNGKVRISPHNFMLESGKTLSIRTTKGSDKVAPRTVGQAGLPILNEYFADIYGKEIENKDDIKKLMFNHIDEVLPVFIEKLFQSDYTILINRKDINNVYMIKADEVADFTFTRGEFEFTRDLREWRESTTLKYNGKSIAEIQVHEKRLFKFRFIISNIPEWFKIVKENNETLGISAEAAICDMFGLKKPASFETRASKMLERQLFPVINEAFMNLPSPIEHSGSNPGTRGRQSKCSYDFMLDGNKTLSLKTNKGKMVCPPEVGQPGSETCLYYFRNMFENGVTDVTPRLFKQMVYNKIDEIMPIYIDHMFDSDWLLWIYKEKKEYMHMEIHRDIKDEFKWEKGKFSFTKKTICEWNESNTVKYDGETIGEFQIHRNRNCYKFRFQMYNLLKMFLNDKRILTNTNMLCKLGV